MRRFGGNVALVTGGGPGLGRASGVRMASEGAAVAVADIDPEDGPESCRQIEEAGGKALFVEADITRAEDDERMVAQAIKEFGRLDVLLASAGVGAGGTVVDMTEEYWDRVLDLDLRGIFLSSKHAIPAIRETAGGAMTGAGQPAGACRTR